MVRLDMWLDELDANEGAPSVKAMAAALDWFASTRDGLTIKEHKNR